MRPLDPRLLRHARQARVYIAAVSALGAATAALVIVQAQLLATGITAAFLHGATLSALRGTLVALAAVVAGRVVLAWTTEAASYHASAAVKAELRGRLLARATELGPRWLAGQRQAELTALATDGIEALDGYFAKYLPQLVLAAVVPVAVLVRVGWSDPLAGLTIAATLPLIPLFGALVGKATGAYARRRWRTLAVLSHHFLDVVSGLPTLKVFGRTKAQREVIGEVTGDYRQATMGTLRIAFLSSLVLELVATISVALVAVAVGLSLVYGHLDLRTGLIALILAPEAYLPLRQAAAQFHASADGLAAADEALAVIETESPATGRAASPATGVAAPQLIRAEGVTVRHPGRPEPAPDQVSFLARVGEITAIAGPSGSGKSTLIDVLLGVAGVRSGTLAGVALAVLALLPLAVHEVFGGLAPAAQEIPRLRAASARVSGVLQHPDPVTEPAEPVALPGPPYDITIRDLTVRWGEDEPDVLRGADLDLPAGSRVAVTGPSGSGKTTLAMVLLRFLDPCAGTVTLGGTDITALDGDQVRSVIGLCAQDATG